MTILVWRERNRRLEGSGQVTEDLAMMIVNVCPIPAIGITSNDGGGK